MARFKLSFYCDSHELGTFVSLIDDRKVVISPVRAVEQPVARPMISLTPNPPRTPTIRELDGEQLSKWRSVVVMLRAFDHVTVCAPQDFKEALAREGYSPDSWSSIVNRLCEVNILRRVRRGRYTRSPELRAGASG